VAVQEALAVVADTYLDFQDVRKTFFDAAIAIVTG
jgi:hypothetical protein